MTCMHSPSFAEFSPSVIKFADLTELVLCTSMNKVTEAVRS